MAKKKSFWASTKGRRLMANARAAANRRRTGPKPKPGMEEDLRYKEALERLQKKAARLRSVAKRKKNR